MASVISTNMASLVAQKNLSKSQDALATSVERLSSGMRINRAKDDAAGLAISARLSSQIGTVNQASRNASDAISIVQTAEGAMSEVSTMLQRMKELSTQAASGALSSAQQGFIVDEMTALRDEIDKVAVRTTFNGMNLIDGSSGTALTRGGTLTDSKAISTKASVSEVSIANTATAGTYTLNFRTAADADANASVTQIEMSNGTTTQKLTMAAAPADGASVEYDFSAFGIKVKVAGVNGVANDDIATALDGTTVTLTASGSRTFQVGADTSGLDDLTLTFGDLSMTATGSAGTPHADMAGVATALSTFSGAKTTTNAEALGAAISTAIDYVASKRAALGAVQNRLDHNIANLQAQSENLSSARSRIQDTDYAAETAQLTKTQIMQQAATAMLAQANQMPNVVLSLLK